MSVVDREQLLIPCPFPHVNGGKGATLDKEGFIVHTFVVIEAQKEAEDEPEKTIPVGEANKQGMDRIDAACAEEYRAI